VGCNNDFFLVIFFYLPYLDVSNDRDTHQVVMFNDTGTLYSVFFFLL
jgi:hypothetical protein